MEILIHGTKKELEKIETIQEAMNEAMSSLVDEGFSGTIKIIEKD